VSEKITVGIIGAGRIGRLHAEHLAYRIPQANVLVVCDIILEAAQKCVAECDIPTAAQDHRAIMEDPDIEAVIICSSTDTHAQMIEEAAVAGKHIFCEKPIALDLARIDQALEAVEKAGVKLQVGFNRRFDANHSRVRQAVEQDEIGEPHLLHIISRDPAPPPIEYVRVSGGIFLDMTIHDFDMARFLIGSEVEEIYAVGGVMVDPACPDLCYYKTEVGETWGQHWQKDYPSPTAWNISQNIQGLIAAGADPIDVTMERLHQHGLTVLAGIRVNDRHHRTIEFMRTRFYLEHPEWVIEGSVNMDYAVPQVREHRLDIVKEILAHDVDGISLDFPQRTLRFPASRRKGAVPDRVCGTGARAPGRRGP